MMTGHKKVPVCDTEASNHLGYSDGTQVWKETPIASLLAEEKGEGFWRLQTEDAHFKKLMKPRVWNARSPWHLTGRSSTTCIFRRRFSSTRNALQSVRVILDRGASECSFVRDKSKLLFKIVSRAKTGRKAVHTHG